jgi:hypothetical protein
MRRQDLWVEEYRHRRYMKNLSDEDLAQRFRDVTANVTTLTPDGKIGVVTSTSPDFDFWWSRQTHLFEEFGERGGLPPWILDDARLPFTYGAVHPGAQAVAGRSFPERYLAKFGHARFMRTALEQGKFLVRRASWYQDGKLNPALRDTELSLDLSVYPQDLGEDPDTVSENAIIRLSTGTDYYILSLAGIYDPRLYDEFEYDACLIIDRPQEFLDRIGKALSEALPEWSGVFGPIGYVDPLNPAAVAPGKFFLKHFRYAFQQEQRVVWIPPTPHDEGSLPDLEITIGPLSDVSDLVKIEPFEERRKSAVSVPPKRPAPYDESSATGIDALPAGPETDRLVFECLIRPAPPERGWWDRGPDELRPFSTDHEASEALVSRMVSLGWGYWFDVEDEELLHRGGRRVRFTRDATDVDATAATVELATCRAALKAARASGLWDGGVPLPPPSELGGESSEEAGGEP